MPAPAQLACLTCGYDLSGIETPRCPECGCAFTDQDRAPMERLSAILTNGDAIPWKQIGLWAIVVVVYSLGAWIMNGDAGFPALLLAVPLLAVACYSSLALGSVVLLGCERPKRLAAQDAWRRELWVLHLPWLVIAPGTVVLLGLAFMIRATDGYDEDTLVYGAIALFCWLPCSLVTPFFFMRRAERRLDASGANTPTIRVRMWLAALLVLGGAVLLGFGGGLLARHGAAHFAGLTSAVEGF
jgi:hypothetical protein